MRIILLFSFLLGFSTLGLAMISGKYEEDIIKTSSGSFTITFLGHGSLMFAYQDKIIHIDPYGEVADYSKLPKADLVLLTHEHYDHYDQKAFNQILKPQTVVIASQSCAGQVKNALILRNGDTKSILGLKIEAVPAYNIVHKRPDGLPFHPKGNGNGYIITFDDIRVYVAGDTENIPEMKTLKNIDIAFLPMNLPYTMTPEMVADAAQAFRPKILYPYHYGQTNAQTLVNLLKKDTDIEIRIRKLS